MNERVLAATAAWSWVPPGAPRIESAEYLAVRYPDWFEHPLQLLRCTPERPLDEVLDEVVDRCGELDQPRIDCWVRLDAPTGLEESLIARGGVLDETLDVLARDLGDLAGDDLPTALHDLLAPPADVVLRWSAEDLDVLLDAATVGAEVFGGSLPTRDAMAAELDGERAKFDSGGGGAVVAYVDGRPVASAGVTVVGADARLWGGAVQPAHRGRGIYRALLASRLLYAVVHGARLALVKGRVETSAPILRRAGFAAFGQERSYLLDL